MDRQALVRANWLLSAMFAASMGMSFPLVFQHLERSFDASALVVGAVAAGSGLVQVVLRIPVGRLIDRRGERPVLLGAWMATAVGGLLFALELGAAMVGVAFAFYSIGIGVYWVAANTLASRLALPGTVARSMTTYMIALGLGFLIGPTLGGIADVIGFAAALALLLPWGLAGFFITARLRVPPPEASAPHETIPPGLWLGIAGHFYFGYFLGAADAFAPVFLAAAGLSAFAVGVFFSLREGVNFVTRLVSTRWVTDTSGAWFTALGAASMGLGVLIFPRVHGAMWLAVVAVIMGVGIGLLGPAALTLTARGSRRGATGRAMGLAGTALAVGLVVGPTTMAPAAHFFGIARVFELTAAVGLVLVVVSVVTALKHARA